MTAGIDAAISYVRMPFQNDAGAHDAEHTTRVYRNALLVAENEPGCDQKIVAPIALPHEADDQKLFHTEENAHARP